MRRVNWPDGIEMPNDMLFDHKFVEHVQKNIGATATCHPTGDSLKEKYTSLYAKLKELTNTILSKGGKGFFWIVTSSDIVNWIEEVTYEKYARSKFILSADDHMPLGYNYVAFWGILDRKWRVYVDPLVPADNMLIGAGYAKKTSEYYASLKIDGMF